MLARIKHAGIVPLRADARKAEGRRACRPADALPRQSSAQPAPLLSFLVSRKLSTAIAVIRDRPPGRDAFDLRAVLPERGPAARLQ
jgi:hypothetical protein